MTDRIYPSSKPTTANGNANGAVLNGTSTAHPPAAAASAGGGGPAPAPSKAQLYRPYNPTPSQHRRTGRRRNGGCRCTPCRCCFWTVLVILLILLLAATVSAVLYLLYHPHKPTFAVSYLQTARLNLSSSAAASSATLSASFNLTLLAKNPNSHTFTYFFDPTVVSLLSSSSVLLGNSSLPAFVSFPKNQTNFRNVVASGDFQDLDVDTVTALRSDLRRKNGVPLTVQLDTKISVKAGGLKSKKVGIRITCDGFRGVVPPKSKAAAASVASVSESKCKVDLRIKIWKFTF